MPFKKRQYFNILSQYRAGHDVEYQQGIENRNYDGRE